MASLRRPFYLLLLLLSWRFLPGSQQARSVARLNEDIAVDVFRLSENVLVLDGVAPNGVVTALSTEEGIVVIDTGVSRSFGEAFRGIVEREFRRRDFRYVINTHADRDHTFGNQAFIDASMIGHENAYGSLQSLRLAWDDRKDDYVSLHRGRAEKNLQDLRSAVLDPEQASGRRQAAAVNSLIVSDLSEGQRIIPPAITFTERLTLRLGTMSLHLFYLGEGHSGSDILIHVPQEGLIVAGDAFLKGALIGSLKQDRFDLDRYLETLNSVLDGGAPITSVVCGHGPAMGSGEFSARRDYLDSLSKTVRQAYSERLGLETAIQRSALEDVSYLPRLLGKTAAELHPEHVAIVRTYWSKLDSQASPEPNRLGKRGERR